MIVDKIVRSRSIIAKFKRRQSSDAALLVVPGNKVASWGGRGDADWERATPKGGHWAVVRDPQVVGRGGAAKFLGSMASTPHAFLRCA